MAERFALPPVITASSWGNVWGALQKSPRGVARDSDGVQAPKWTNREALAVIVAAREAARRMPGGFPLWYQFSAGAYGWDPATDRVQRTQAQADAVYDPDLAVMLSAELKRLTADLDRAGAPDARLTLSDAWDAAWADVVRALQQDGAEAAFKIPLPACKDPKTGKPARPVKKDGKWGCPGGVVTIDDPLTAITKSVAKIAVPAAVILIAAWILQERRGSRRSRR